MNRRRISSKVVSRLTDKLDKAIRTQMSDDSSFHVHVQTRSDKLYELDCDVTIQIVSFDHLRGYNDPPQTPCVSVASDTYSLTSIDDFDKVEHYDAEPIINEVIRSFK